MGLQPGNGYEALKQTAGVHQQSCRLIIARVKVEVFADTRIVSTGIDTVDPGIEELGQAEYM